jgi:hypothetical protein
MSLRKCTVQPLPATAEHPGDRVPEALVSVGDAPPEAGEAAGLEREQELGPERFGLRLALPIARRRAIAKRGQPLSVS